MDTKVIQQLTNIVGPKNLTTTKEDLLCYSYDGCGREFLPDAVAFPATTREVSEIMKLAAKHSFPVIPRGAGTGMTGGALAVNGGLILAMGRMNRIIEIDQANQIAVVEPGVITGQLQKEVGRAGLFYPPDPASHDFCTIGGNVGECAGGPRAVKYGVTRDYVLGLEAVLPDGRIINTGVKTAKGVAGYDLTRLLIGSEGTLAVITRIILKLLPQPAARKTFLLSFDDLANATALVSRILSRITPCTLEYMDRTALRVVSDSIPYSLPEVTEALLLIELDGDRDVVELQSDTLKDFLTGQPGLLEIRTAATNKESSDLWAARKAISPSTFKLKPHKIGEDIVVPRTRIPELVRYTEELSTQLDLTILTFGHAGDGNIHVNIMLDRNNPKQEAAGKTAKENLFSRVIEMEGTITGEHGIGITKAAFLEQEIGSDTLNTMRAIKKTFDPENILNPGKIFI